MIVVDTHAVIWLTQDQELLSDAASAALIEGRREGRLAIADITLREIAEQVIRGRLVVSSPLDVYLRFRILVSGSADQWANRRAVSTLWFEISEGSRRPVDWRYSDRSRSEAGD